MISVQDEDFVHSFCKHRVHFIIFCRNSKTHAQEVLRIAEIVAWANEWLAYGIFVSTCRNRWHFRDKAVCRDHALHRIVDVSGVVVEGRQSANCTHHNSHWVSVAAIAFKEAIKLCVQHRVMRDGVSVIVELSLARKFTIQEKVAGFKEA